MGWLGPDATSVVNLTEVELLVYFALVFSFKYCRILFVLFPFKYLELYVLGDTCSSWIS